MEEATTAAERNSGARVILYCVESAAYQLLSAWAAREHHSVVLVVTTPGRPDHRNTMYRDVVALAPPEQDVLVTTGMRRIAPMIATLAPDLIVSFTFPFRIPPEVTTIPRYGAVNLHPAPLPRYRGPNPVRMIYNGEPTLAATLHRSVPEFDAGAILSRHERPLPDDPSLDNILAAWDEIMMAVLTEGTRRALAGEPGTPQDDALASYAPPFTDEELWLDWNEPKVTIQRRASALNLVTVQAKGMIDGKEYRIHRVTPLPDAAPADPPGRLLGRHDGVMRIRAADGVVEVVATEP